MGNHGHCGRFYTGKIVTQCILYFVYLEKAILAKHRRLGNESIPLKRNVKSEYFVVAPILKNDMAVIGDTEKFITMADKRIASVDDNETSIKVSVISCNAKSPTIVGYSIKKPLEVIHDNVELTFCTSLGMLNNAECGWFWDYSTKLWYVKIDFSGVKDMGVQTFLVK